MRSSLSPIVNARNRCVPHAGEPPSTTWSGPESTTASVENSVSDTIVSIPEQDLCMGWYSWPGERRAEQRPGLQAQRKRKEIEASCKRVDVWMRRDWVGVISLIISHFLVCDVMETRDFARWVSMKTRQHCHSQQLLRPTE